MKFITKNILKFVAFLTIWTFVFRYFLSEAIREERWIALIFIAFIYGLVIFLWAWFLGKKDYEELPLYDIGFRFHLVTYIICNGITFIWLNSGLQAASESLSDSYLGILIWTIALLFHFLFYLYTRKNAINGINRSDIFE